MKVIGLTGGIGSGKTTVCQIFETLNVPVFYADTVGKELMVKDPDVKQAVIQLFGPEAYEDHVLNRSYIAGIVFDNSEMLQKLNQIIHPAVRRAGQRWKKENSSSPYGIQEVAILFESGAFRFVDQVINVWAPRDIRIERVMGRDRVNRDAVEQRMANQISDGLRLSLSDYVIVNDGHELLLPQVMRIHRLLLS